MKYMKANGAMPKFSANENRFEGQWLNDKKNGRGKYFFLTTGQLMEGVWCDDVPKNSQIVDLGREVARNPTESEIPEVSFYIHTKFIEITEGMKHSIFKKYKLSIIRLLHQNREYVNFRFLI
ncbi:unnamed protein product [Trichobilharzia regenti]|nr:unnamed protein product [Trichobilharzia regenti]